MGSQVLGVEGKLVQEVISQYEDHSVHATKVVQEAEDKKEVHSPDKDSKYTNS